MLQNLKASLSTAYSSILSRKYVNLGLLCLALLGWYFIGFAPAFFACILLLCIVNRFSTKILVLGALTLLISIPLLLIFEEDILAEEMAVYVYYLLVSTVIVEIVGYIRERISRPNITTSKQLDYASPEEEPNTPLQLTSRPVSLEFVRPSSISKTLSFEPLISSEETLPNHVNKQLRSIEFKEAPQSTTDKQDSVSSQFRPYKLLQYWNYYVIAISGFIPYIIFRFTGLPSFRDLTTVPYFYNIQSSKFDLSVIEKLIFNQFTSFIRPETVASIFFQLSFFLGAIVSYFYLLKIQAKFAAHISNTQTYTNKALVFLISLLYVYNPFTFERFLMGQHYVLRGHLLFIPVLYYLLGFLEVFLHAKKPTFKLLSEHNIHIITQFGWALTLMALLSTHHAVFAIYLVITGLFFLGVTNIKHIIRYAKTLDTVQGLNQILKVITIFVLLILPTLIIFINRYANTPTQVTYSQQTTIKSDNITKIISAFSLKVPEEQNLVEKALIGAASWNTPSFAEVNSVSTYLGSLKKFTTYFSPKLNVLLIICMIVLIGYCAYLSDKKFNPLIFPLMLLLPIILVLNFGYSLNFESINSLYFSTPFSYTFREAGKFYSLFLALLAVVLVTSSEYFLPRIRQIVIGFFTFILLGNILIFLPLSQSIVYADYPQIIKDLSNTCKRGDKSKILFLPFNTYIYPSYSNIFTGNYSQSLLNCDVVTPDYATLDDRNSNQKIDTIEIANSKVATSINGIIATFTKSTPNENPYETMRKELKTFGINTLIVDDTNYSDTGSYDLGVFNKKLQQYVAADKVEKDETKSIYIYILK
jgi:hypothetical protein